jgi:fructokinase
MLDHHMSSDKQSRPVIFGEVLFDIFPDGSEVMGGAPFNVAWHLRAFGINPLFISRVGDDALGHAIRDAMRQWAMDPSGLQTDASRPTGTVKVDLHAGEPSFDIKAERAYDHIDADLLPNVSGRPLLYHGSLALRASPSRAALAALKERSVPRPFVDVNLRAPWWERESVLGLLEGASWVKINADELGTLVPEAAGPPDKARILSERFGLRGVFVTQGAAGAFALTPGGDILRVAPTADVPVVDAVGAGDAFASVLILALHEGWPLEQGLERAQSFASAMVGQRGATVTDPAFYRPFVDAWGL